MLRPMSLTDLFFGNAFEDLFNVEPMCLRPSVHQMRSDIKKKDGKLEISIELPGIKKEDIGIDLKDGILTVKGKTAYDSTDTKADDEKAENNAVKVLMAERYVGEFARTFTVGKDVTPEDISATYENGVLVIEVALKEPAEPQVQAIEIK